MADPQWNTNLDRTGDEHMRASDRRTASSKGDMTFVRWFCYGLSAALACGVITVTQGYSDFLDFIGIILGIAIFVAGVFLSLIYIE